MKCRKEKAENKSNYDLSVIDSTNCNLGIKETLAEKLERRVHYGSDMRKGWMMGPGKEKSKQIKWRIYKGEEGLGLVG